MASDLVATLLVKTGWYSPVKFNRPGLRMQRMAKMREEIRLLVNSMSEDDRAKAVLVQPRARSCVFTVVMRSGPRLPMDRMVDGIKLLQQVLHLEHLIFMGCAEIKEVRVDSNTPVYPEAQRFVLVEIFEKER